MVDKETIIERAVRAEVEKQACLLSSAWQQGKALDDLMILLDVKGENGRLAADPAYRELSKSVRKATGEEYGKSIWLHWRRMYKSFTRKQINKLSELNVSCHECIKAAFDIKTHEGIVCWISGIESGAVSKSYYTTRQEKLRKRNRKGNGSKITGIVSFEVKGDETEDDMVNMVASLLSSAVRIGHNYQTIVDNAVSMLGNR